MAGKRKGPRDPVEEMRVRRDEAVARVEKLKEELPEAAKATERKETGNGGDDDDPYKGTNITPVTLRDGTVRYRLKFYVGMDPDKPGRREFFNSTFDTLGEAKDKAASLRTSRAGGAPVRPTRETLSAYLKRWLSDVKEGEVRARTLYDYRYLLGRYVFKPSRGMPALGRMQLNKLNPQHFQSLYAHMRRDLGLSPRTIQYLHTVLRGALKHAVLMGQLARDPSQGVKPPKQPPPEEGGETEGERREKKIRAMSKEQALAFQEAAREDRFYALWILLLHTGMRPGEALGLKWSPDMDLDGNRLHVNRALTRRGVKGWRLVEPKTERARRTITLPPFAVRALREWRAKQAEERLLLGSEYQDHGLVFTTEFGAPLDGRNIAARNFRRILKAAGLGTWEVQGEKRVWRPGFRVYDLRHTHATLLLLAGENVKVVSERLGHAKVTLTLDTYSHVLPTMQEAAAERMEALLGNG